VPEALHAPNPHWLEKLFVDYAGQTVPLIDAVTGEITKAQIFVATFGASNYTFACATSCQTTPDRARPNPLPDQEAMHL
jgi:transposase